MLCLVNLIYLRGVVYHEQEDPMEGWYVAKVKPQKERGLTSYLSQWDVEVFFPQILQLGQSSQVLKPLFPTYIFCYFDPRSSIWPVVRWAPGMGYILNHEDEPYRVPETLITYLRQQVKHWNERKPSTYLNKGEQVKVLGGPFSGLEGIFQKYVPSRKRCNILLEVIGRLTSVELPEYHIEKASRVEPAYYLG